MINFFLFSLLFISIHTTTPSNCDTDSSIYCVGSGQLYTYVQEAIDEVSSPGDKIYLQGGTYRECLIIDHLTPHFHADGNFTHHIEIQPYPGETVRFRQDVYCGTSNRMIYIVSDFWWIHEGEGSLYFHPGNNSNSLSKIFYISNKGIYMGPFDIENDWGIPDFYAIQNMRSSAHVFDGIRFTGTRGFVQLDQRNRWYGDEKFYGDYKALWIKNCLFLGEYTFDGVGIRMFVDGIYGTIENNYFKCSRTMPFGGDLILIQDGYNLIIQNNIFENGRLGLFCDSSTDTIQDISIHNNLFYCDYSNYHAIRLLHNNNRHMKRIKIQNNLFIGVCGKTATGGAAIYNQHESGWFEDNCVISHNVQDDPTVTLLSDTFMLAEVEDNRIETVILNRTLPKPSPYFDTLSQHKDGTFIFMNSPSIDYLYNGRSQWGVSIGHVEVWVNCSASNDGWSQDKWCYQCEGWFDPTTDCTKCIGNRDLDYNCDRCLPYYETLVTDCDNCFLSNANISCSGCENVFWRLDSNCSVCHGNRNDQNHCLTCKLYYDNLSNDCDRCLGNRNYSSDCQTCNFPFDNLVGHCDECLGNRDYANGCLTCENQYYDLNNHCDKCYLSPNQNSICSDCLIYWTLASNCSECEGNRNASDDCNSCIDYWINNNDDCGTCKLDVNNRLTDCSGCETFWTTESNCTECVGHRDSSDDCNSCVEYWVDIGSDCGVCILDVNHRLADCSDCLTYWTLDSNCTECVGNRNPSDNCNSCIDYWINRNDDCGTCKLDINNRLFDCTGCEPFWTIESNCTECIGHRDPSDNCNTCLEFWTGLGNDCNICVLHVNNRLSDCSGCIQFLDESTNCTTCINKNRNITNQCTDCNYGYVGLDCIDDTIDDDTSDTTDDDTSDTIDDTSDTIDDTTETIDDDTTETIDDSDDANDSSDFFTPVVIGGISAGGAAVIIICFLCFLILAIIILVVVLNKKKQKGREKYDNVELLEGKDDKGKEEKSESDETESDTSSDDDK